MEGDEGDGSILSLKFARSSLKIISFTNRNMTNLPTSLMVLLSEMVDFAIDLENLYTRDPSTGKFLRWHFRLKICESSYFILKSENGRWDFFYSEQGY